VDNQLETQEQVHQEQYNGLYNCTLDEVEPSNRLKMSFDIGCLDVSNSVKISLVV
jgi:hypothetical protein